MISCMNFISGEKLLAPANPVEENKCLFELDQKGFGQTTDRQRDTTKVPLVVLHPSGLTKKNKYVIIPSLFSWF